MVIYHPRTNILINDKYEFSLQSLYSELNLIGSEYHQNSDNPKKTELHWFLENSAIVISEYEKKANIKIISTNEIYLSHMKSKIEKILEETKPKKR